ncbi:MAG TPA: hypothetical protein VGB99_02445 [Acidobacteriota bacterium]
MLPAWPRPWARCACPCHPIPLVEPSDLRRLDDVSLLNLRIEKNSSFGEGLNLGLGIDIFNAFNSDVVLQRRRQLNSTTFGQIFELVSPRVIRLGARFSF